MIKSGERIIGSDEADEILLTVADQREADWQRPLNQRHVKDYAAQMRAGHFLQKMQIIIGQLNGVLYLLDGQHRLYAVSATGLAQAFTVTIIKFETEAEMRAHYARIDVSDYPRQGKAVMATIPGIHGAVNKVLAEGAYRAAPILGSSLTVYNSRQIPAELISPQARIAVLKPYEPALIKYSQIVFPENYKPKYVRRRMGMAPIVAICLVAISDQPTTGQNFVSAIVDGDELPHAHPCRKLWEALAGGRKQEFGKNAGQELMVAAASLWNRYYLGEADVRQVRDNFTPWGLLGTRFSKVG